MHRQIRALDALELSLDLLLGRVDHDRRTLAEHQFFDLDETQQRAMTDLAGIDLVDPALVHENDLENVTGCHLETWRGWYAQRILHSAAGRRQPTAFPVPLRRAFPRWHSSSESSA